MVPIPIGQTVRAEQQFFAGKIEGVFFASEAKTSMELWLITEYSDR